VPRTTATTSAQGIDAVRGTAVPERFHLRDDGPLQETVGSVNFPSKAPVGRWEVVQLRSVLEALCAELPEPPSWNDPAEADPEELIEHDLELLFRRPWSAYSVAFQELVRHAWVHCTERGVLLEKVRLACEKIFSDCLGVAHRLQSYCKAEGSPNPPSKPRAEELRQEVERLREETQRLKSELNSARGDQRTAEVAKIRAEKRSEELSAQALEADKRAKEAEADNRDLRASNQRSEHEKSSLNEELDSTRCKLDEESRLRESEVVDARSAADSWRSLVALACNVRADLPKDSANLLADIGLPQLARYITLVNKATARHILNGLSIKQQATVITELGENGYLFLDLDDSGSTARLLASLQDPSLAALLLSRLDEQSQASVVSILSQKHAISSRLRQNLSCQAQLMQPLDRDPSDTSEAPPAWVLRLLPTSLEPAHAVTSIAHPSWPSPAGCNAGNMLKLTYLDLASPNSEPIMETRIDLSLPFSDERLLCLLSRMPPQHALLVATCGHFPVLSLPRSASRLRELGADLSNISTPSPLALACAPSEGHLKVLQGGLDSVLAWDGRLCQFRLVSQSSLPDAKCSALLRLVGDQEEAVMQSNLPTSLDVAAKATLARNIHPLRRIFIAQSIAGNDVGEQLTITPRTFLEICKDAKLKVKEKLVIKLATNVAKANSDSSTSKRASSASGRGRNRGRQSKPVLDINGFLEAIVRLAVRRNRAARGTADTEQQQQQQQQARHSRTAEGAQIEGNNQQPHAKLQLQASRGAYALGCLGALIEDSIVSAAIPQQRELEKDASENVQSVLKNYETTLQNTFSAYADADVDEKTAISLHAALRLASQLGLLSMLSRSLIACAFYDVAVGLQSHPSEKCAVSDL
jgi:hypothetical protein